MEKIKPVTPNSFQSSLPKKEAKKHGQTIACFLLGSKVCPKPDECDGINRKCTLWQQHSGR